MQPDTVVPDRDNAALQPLAVNFGIPILLRELGKENRWNIEKRVPRSMLRFASNTPQGMRAMKNLNEVTSTKVAGTDIPEAPSGEMDWTGPENLQNLNRYAYVQNNPLRYTDPTGFWTFGIGVGYTIGSGGGMSGSVLFVVDTHGGIGFIGSGGGGGYAGVGGGGSIIVQATNADRIQDLNGPVVQTGGSAILGPDVGLQGGTEWLVQHGPKGSINGANLFVGGAENAPLPIEMHSMLEYGKVVSFGTLLKKAGLWLKEVVER